MRTPILLLAALPFCACSPDQTTAPSPATPRRPNGPTAALNGAGAPTAQKAIVGRTSGLSGRISSFPVVINIPSDALFEFDRATLSSAATAELRKAADAIRSGGPGEVTIAGHTDARGSDAYNVALSERRAQAVENWMREQVGVRLRSFKIIGIGEGRPVAPNTTRTGADDPEGRRRNRRVEIVIPPAA